MENSGVKCNVCECAHNVNSCKCDAPMIQITKDATSGQKAMQTPHFCSTFLKK